MHLPSTSLSCTVSVSLSSSILVTPCNVGAFAAAFISRPQVRLSTSPLSLPLYNSSINIIYICTPYNLDKHNIHASLGCSLSLEFFQGDECKHYACIVDFVIGVKPVYSYFFSRTCIYSQFHHPINFAFPILYSTLIMTSTASTPLIYHYA